MKKQQIHVYEIYTKHPSGERLIKRTTQMSIAKKWYQRTDNARLRIDGNEQPILAADKLMRAAYGREIIIPRYQAPVQLDSHHLKPAE